VLSTPRSPKSTSRSRNDIIGRVQHRRDVQSFHHLTDVDLDDRCCQGTACFVARHLDPERWREATAAGPRVYCLGKCYTAPASGRDDTRPPHVEVDAPQAIVLERVAFGGARTLDGYRRSGGLAALDRALALAPDAIVAEVEQSRLRGRGGAGFPTGAKMRTVLEERQSPKYVVCNADEGDPGAYIDRFVMEDDPFGVLEAMAVAGRAVGAERGYIYLRREYPEAFASLQRAIDGAREEGVLGPDVLGRGVFSFDVEVVVGEGSYVCGEETALLNAIEGRRPEVRVRPPYPGSRGLFGCPTLVDNVETLVNIPWIVRHGGDAYAALGRGESRGTKVVSLNSLFARPGLYEVELGIPVRRIVEDLGGGLRTGELGGVIVGGPLAGVIPPALLDVPLTFEDLHGIGAALGHGGVVAFDENTTIAELVHHVFAFGAYESCGKCTPCRVGSGEVEATFAEVLAGRAPVGRRSFDGIVAALHATSLCGHGSGLAEFAQGVARNFPEELDSCFG
jgi:NADH:ubiquinone oxidoreductase subunit F (NADH-binding)